MENLRNDRNTNMCLCLFVRVVLGKCGSHCGGVFTLVFMYGRICIYICLMSTTAVFSEHLHAWVSTLACIINSPLCRWPVLWLRASLRGWCTIPAGFNTLECVCVSVDLPLGGLCANTLFQTVSGWCLLGKDGAVPQKRKGAVNESHWHFRTPPQFLSCSLRSTQHSHGSALLISWAYDTLLCYVMMY